MNEVHVQRSMRVKKESKRESDIKRMGWSSVVKGYCHFAIAIANYHVLYVQTFRFRNDIRVRFINLIFLSYWFVPYYIVHAIHAETLDNHFTTVMMNIRAFQWCCWLISKTDSTLFAVVAVSLEQHKYERWDEGTMR